MNNNIRVALIGVLAGMLAACGGGSTTGASNISVPDGGRLLASQCFQCHGTNGSSVSGIESISGESAGELVEEMREMKYSNNLNDIMHRQAMGYSEDQIYAIAAYLSTLPAGQNGGDD